MDRTDRELLQACRRDDGRAWNELLEKYERLIFSIALSYGLSTADAADITQLTFSIFLESMDDLADDSNLKAWLATVARRHTWRLMRRRRRERVHGPTDLGDSLYMIPDESGERKLERWELIDWLQQGLNRLDERCRNLLLALYFAPGRPTYAEVAEELDMAVGSVGPTRARCLERLRAALED